MTEQEWLNEITALRSDLGPLRPVRMTWRWVRPVRWATASVLQLVLGRGRDPAQLWLDLYEENAATGSPAMAEVRVEPNRAIESIDQGAAVHVAGRIEPGHAVVILTTEWAFWPLSPVTTRLRPPRLP